VKKIEIHFILFSIIYFLKSCSLSNIVGKYCTDRTQTTIWLMRLECWIPKATKAYSECVIHIAFPLQQFLYGRTAVLRFMYTACLFIHLNTNPRGMSHRNPLGWPQSRFIFYGEVIDFLLLLGIEFCDCKCNNLKGLKKKGSPFLRPLAGVIGLSLSELHSATRV